VNLSSPIKQQQNHYLLTKKLLDYREPELVAPIVLNPRTNTHLAMAGPIIEHPLTDPGVATAFKTMLAGPLTICAITKSRNLRF
tara:strand:- start:255 stop:506 length:252 start_codon:yes stop_codon:yes gene_type:complete